MGIATPLPTYLYHYQSEMLSGAIHVDAFAERLVEKRLPAGYFPKKKIRVSVIICVSPVIKTSIVRKICTSVAIYINSGFLLTYFYSEINIQPA